MALRVDTALADIMGHTTRGRLESIEGSFEEPVDEGDLSAAFDTEIKPHLSELEAARLAFRRQFVARIIMDVAAVVAGVVATHLAFGPQPLPAALIVTVGVVAFFGWVKAPLKRYDAKVRSLVMPVVCRFLGDADYVRDAKTFDGIRHFVEVGVVGRYSRSHLEDLFTGRYRETDFAMLEATLSRKSGKRSRTVFRGLLFAVSVPIAVRARILIGRDHGALGNRLTAWFKEKGGMSAVAFDDPVFEERYTVYSDDGAEARSVLTSGLRQSLVAIAQAHDRPIRAAFEGGRFLMAMETRHPFLEPASVFRSAHEMDHGLRTLVREATIVQRLIDYLHGDRPGHLA